MRLFFAGTENAEWRKFLADEGVSDVSLSYVRLAGKIKFARPWTIADHFTPQTAVLLDSGAYSLNKPDADITAEEAADIAARYMAFVTGNIDSVELVTEFDAAILGPEWIRAMRADFWDDIGDKFVPVWRVADGREALEELGARYAHVGVLQAGLDEHAIPLLNDVTRRLGVRLHGLGMTSTELIQAIRWDSVGSTSWISPSQYGDTIIWTGHELKRYPRKYQEQARKRHRSWIGQQGFDAAKILADDRKEVLRLSVWSWQQYTAWLNRRTALTPPPVPSGAQDAEPTQGEIDAPLAVAGNQLLLPAVPVERPLKPVPVVGVTSITAQDEDGRENEERVLSASPQSLLRCDTCEIRDMCPEFRAGHACAYEFPAYVSTKNQMRALQDFLIALQTQRVQRMALIEQIKGGYADSNLSAEEDRLQRMINAKREAERQGFTLHLESRGDASAGAISRLLGRDVGDEVTALPAPVPAGDIMETWLEAEVIQDPGD